MANKPTNPQLYSRVKSEAKKKFDRWPSAYGSAWLVKEYKRRGGGYRKAEDGMEVPGYDLMSNGGMMYGDYYFPMMDEGGEMALGQIAAVTDKMSKLQQFLDPNSEIEPWIASKLAVMDHSAGAIYDYMMYNPEAQEQEEPEMEEMRDGGIPNRYKNMGFSKVGAKKKSTRPGKKWMVLAKKGDQYKVVHGGDSKMKDFKQHGSEKRKDRFWDRMGGRDSAKAKDPFSPLYWHKKFGTWAEGGEPQNAGFQALPPEVQAKIMANMMYGGDMDYAMGGQPCYKCGGQHYKQGGIHIDPSKKGTFKAQATRMGMGVQEAANAILNAPEGKYSPEMRRKANFAKNFAKQDGGLQLDFSAFENMDPIEEVTYDEQFKYMPGKSKNMWVPNENFMASWKDARGRFNPTIAGNIGDDSFRMTTGQALPAAAFAAFNAASWVGKKTKDRNALNEIYQGNFSDNLYPTIPGGITGAMGNYDIFGEFRPNETLASRTYYNEMGGEIEMTDDQIKQLVALGAEIEFLD